LKKMKRIPKAWRLNNATTCFMLEKQGTVWERGCGCVPKKFEIFFFFFAKIKYGLYVLNRFDVLMSKMIFKK